MYPLFHIRIGKFSFFIRRQMKFGFGGLFGSDGYIFCEFFDLGPLQLQWDVKPYRVR